MTIEADVINQIERYSAWLESQLGPVPMPETGRWISPAELTLTTVAPVRRRGAGGYVVAAAAVALVVAAAIVVGTLRASPSSRTAPASVSAAATDPANASGASAPADTTEKTASATESETTASQSAAGTSTSAHGSSTVAASELQSDAWVGARTSSDGRQILMQISGAASFEPGDPCTADYAATAEETAERVTISVTGVRPNGSYSCRSVRYLRALTVDLVEPLGERRVLAFGEVRDVFNGKDLATVTWMPASWSPGREGAAGLFGWFRTWSPDRPTDQANTCIPSVPGLRLFEQPADAPVSWQPDPGSEVVGEYQVKGATAVLTTVPDRNVSALAWTVDGRSFELRTEEVCAGDPDVDLDTFLRVARNITPSDSAGPRTG